MRVPQLCLQDLIGETASAGMTVPKAFAGRWASAAARTADACYSRIAITRRVGFELEVVAALHMHRALSRAGKIDPHLATSRSIAAPFAQPSLSEDKGIARTSCRCRIVRRAAASSRVPPRRRWSGQLSAPRTSALTRSLAPGLLALGPTHARFPRSRSGLGAGDMLVATTKHDCRDSSSPRARPLIAVGRLLLDAWRSGVAMAVDLLRHRWSSPSTCAADCRSSSIAVQASSLVWTTASR